jgi:hypothetical protein
MIVHILPPARGFPAVSYNTDKVERNKGELMKVSGFDALKGLQILRPEDYKHHLAMVSATNKHVRRPQFHVVISAEGKSYDKHQLTRIGEEWLTAMGYQKQPYLIIFHKDTANNHVHLVTTRIDGKGKKISDRFEKIRAVAALNRILGVGLENKAKTDLEYALSFRLATDAQFRMILESKGHVIREHAGKYQLIKFGKVLESIDKSLVIGYLKKKEPDERRKTQLKAWFHKYAPLYPTSLEKSRTAYRSDFSNFMKGSFGVELVFHASADKPPYGYTIIDHSGRNVFKGSEIMPLKDLLSINLSGGTNQHSHVRYEQNTEQLDFYAAILKAALYNYPDLIQGLNHQGLMIIRTADGLTLHDPSAGVFIDIRDLLNPHDHEVLIGHISQEQENGEVLERQCPPMPWIVLASDIDDEAILGQNRRRVRKARTNTR